MAETTSTRPALALLKRVLPDPLQRAFRQWRHTDSAARGTLVRLWIGRRFRNPDLVLPRGLAPAPRVLFVCHGNILRSAVAEAFYEQACRAGLAPAGSRAESAGVNASDGRPADPRGIRVATEFGLALTDHRARRLTRVMLDAADLVLVMDQVNEAEVVARFPAHAAKVRMLGGLLTTPPTSAGPNITDPFLGDEEAVRHAFAQVGLAVRALSAILSKSRAPSN